MKQEMVQVPSGELEIRQQIKTIRGVQVMLDRDLAELYGVQTKQLKRQVKRNIRRFPRDFMIELSERDMKSLRCQIGTSNRGGDRYGAPSCTTSARRLTASVAVSPPTRPATGRKSPNCCRWCHDRPRASVGSFLSRGHPIW